MFNSSSFEKIVLLITELMNAYFINVCLFSKIDFIAAHKIRDKEIFFQSVYLRKMSEIGMRNFTFELNEVSTMYLVVINQFYNLRSLLFTYDDSSLMKRHSMYFEQLRHCAAPTPSLSLFSIS